MKCLQIRSSRIPAANIAGRSDSWGDEVHARCNLSAGPRRTPEQRLAAAPPVRQWPATIAVLRSGPTANPPCQPWPEPGSCIPLLHASAGSVCWPGHDDPHHTFRNVPTKQLPPSTELRVIKKIAANGRGAKGLTAKYGEELICVRHRLDSTGTRRLTTVELVVSDSTIRRRPAGTARRA